MIEIIIVDKEGKELESVRQLLREYEGDLQEDLSFQQFEKEYENPLLKYGAPSGMLLLAYWSGEVAGCIALTALKKDGVCEMKRLYVRPSCRDHGIGRALIEQLLSVAVEKGYVIMKLDTLGRLQAAIRLYERYGFVHIAPYYVNPISDVVYMEKSLPGK